MAARGATMHLGDCKRCDEHVGATWVAGELASAVKARRCEVSTYTGGGADVTKDAERGRM
eukprot:818526-Prorocentrum_minimum.AAC.5